MTATDPGLGPERHQVDDGKWGILRRLHFFVNDQIMDGLDRIGVSLLERRLLDALAFAEERGVVRGLPVATICELIPPSPKPQTALSALGRMAAGSRPWVVGGDGGGEASGQGRRGRRFRLSDEGDGVRRDYQRLAEIVLRETYGAGGGDHHTALLVHGEAVVAMMDAELGPLVDALEPGATGRLAPSSGWSALGTAHFHLNDVFFARAQRLGVEPLDRRILDALSYAASRGFEDGVDLAVLDALLIPSPRSGLAVTALERMTRLGWIEAGGGRRPSSRQWRLAERGRQVRDDYKSVAERQIEQAYGPEGESGLLLPLAREAEEHRLCRLEPILRHRLG